MDLNVEVTKSVFQFICGETQHICRLCLSSINKHEISVEKAVHLKKPYFDETLTYLDMFMELGIPSETGLPQVICNDCATIVNCSFLLQKLCQYSNLKWNEALEKLDNALNLSSSVNPEIQSLYLVINKDENLVFTSKKSFTDKNKKTTLLKIKSIVKSKYYYENFMKKNKKSFNGEVENLDLTCSLCNESFQTKISLSRHMRNHDEDRHACPKCGKVFSSQLQVKGHVERVHKPKNIQCPHCVKSFSTKQILRFHKQLHHVPTVCKICCIQFPSKYMLKGHLDKHDVNECPKCRKRYVNKNTYRFHLKICGVTEKTLSFFCDICGKGYVRKNGIRTHLKVDHGFGKVLSCNWCSKKFDAESRLRYHIVKHTRERNYPCDICGNKFVTPAALVYHKRLHTGEKPFPCDVCDESFLSASRRREHKLRKHLGPTKICPVCQMKFISGHQLKKHLERHSNPESKLYVPNNHLLTV